MSLGSVLVVEDDPTLSYAIARNLEARQYEPRHSSTVLESIHVVQTMSPVLAIIDIDLPDGSGWDVVRHLTAHMTYAVPIIVISALQPNPRLCKEMAVSGVIEKPFPADGLLWLVHRRALKVPNNPESDSSAQLKTAAMPVEGSEHA